MRDNYKCFNCNKKCGQPLAKCPEPRNEALIEKRRAEHKGSKSKKKSSSNKPRRKIATDGKHKGRPLILNKNDAYVIDTFKEQTTKTLEKTKAAADIVKQYMSQSKAEETTSNETPPASEPALPAANNARIKLQDVQAALNGLC